MTMPRVWMSRVRRWSADSRPFHVLASVLLHGYLIIVGVVGTLALISAIPGARIDTFLIEGNDTISTDVLTHSIEERLREPFLVLVGRDVPIWAPQETIAASVYALDPHVRDVSVSGRFSRTLKVNITEEIPAMLWCGSDVPTSTTQFLPCWFANDRGTIYARAPEYPDAPYPKFFTTPAPIFFDPYPRTHDYPLGYVIADGTTMGHLKTLRDALPERGYEVVALGVTEDADVVVFTKEGTRFLLSLSRSILEDMRRFESLREALRTKEELVTFTEVDLRFDTKIYYK